MVQQSVITDEMRSLIGRETEVLSEVVERGAIRRLVEAVEEPNPLYVDEAYARTTRFGGVIAPATFLCTIGHTRKGGHREPRRSEPLYKRPYNKSMHAADDWEFFEPVRPGDTITAKRRIAEFYEKQGQKTPLLFSVSEISYYNQLGQLVAKLRISGVSWPG